LAADWKKGLSLKVWLGILYPIVVLNPVVIWLTLSTGSTIGAAGAYVTLLLLVWFSKYMGSPFSRQEAFLVYAITLSTTSIFTWWVNHIYNIWWRNSPISSSFGISEIMPDWYTPKIPDVWKMRTFFHPSWIPVFSLWLTVAFLVFVADVSIGLILYKLLGEVERLPFPMAEVGAVAVNTLTEAEPERMRVVTVSMLMGIIYTLIAFAPPILTGIPSLIPYPWADWNAIIHNLLPGASLGISTDPLIVTIGFLLPGSVSISLFVGSFAVYFIGNWLIVPLGLFPDWFPGLNITYSYQRSIFDFWINPIIGIGLAAGFLPLLRHPQTVKQAFSAIFRVSPAMSYMRTLVVSYIVSVTALGVLTAILAPDFPLWIVFILSIGWQFTLNLISARALGVTGQIWDLPAIGPVRSDKAFIILASGSKSTNIWFTPLYIGPSGASWCQNFKVAELCGASQLQYIKAWFIALPISLIVSFIFTQAFWTIAPVPSGVYPWPAAMWPIAATYSSMFITGKITLLNSTLLLGSAVITAIFYLIVDFLRLPFSIIAFASGTAMPLPYGFGIFIGWIIGKIISHRLGRDWWNRNRSIIVAGLAIGESLIIAIATSVALINKFMWVQPF